jgi:anti-anti-sigma regulatory factor
MFVVEADPSKPLFIIHHAQRVSADEVRLCVEQARGLLTDMKPGFRVLVDLSRLESMDTSCAPEIGAMMDLLAEKQVGTVVRVVPDPDKDIGFNIMSLFHYGPEVQRITCEDLTAALQSLSDEC